MRAGRARISSFLSSSSPEVSPPRPISCGSSDCSNRRCLGSLAWPVRMKAMEWMRENSTVAIMEEESLPNRAMWAEETVEFFLSLYILVCVISFGDPCMQSGPWLWPAGLLCIEGFRFPPHIWPVIFAILWHCCGYCTGAGGAPRQWEAWEATRRALPPAYTGGQATGRHCPVTGDTRIWPGDGQALPAWILRGEAVTRRLGGVGAGREATCGSSFAWSRRLTRLWARASYLAGSLTHPWARS